MPIENGLHRLLCRRIYINSPYPKRQKFPFFRSISVRRDELSQYHTHLYSLVVPIVIDGMGDCNWW